MSDWGVNFLLVSAPPVDMAIPRSAARWGADNRESARVVNAVNDGARSPAFSGVRVVTDMSVADFRVVAPAVVSRPFRRRRRRSKAAR
jgi:hypothetical protein